MNAVKKSTSIAIASKIAAIASLLRSQIPYAQIDFSPWVENDLTLRFEDRHSIDLSVNLPRVSQKLQCRCMLLQVTVPYVDVASPVSVGHLQGDFGGYETAVEVEFSGYGFDGTQQWKFATVNGGQFSGATLPTSDGQQLIEELVQRILELFPSLKIVEIESRKAS
ncbi:MAG: hypothetical protein ACFCBU_08680 [Cyanophyceae cyanobacterium]